MIDGRYQVVYDVDDVLNNLNNIVFNKAGVEGKVTRYYTHENEGLTKSEMAEMNNLYANPDTFRVLEYNEGAERICDIEKTGFADVFTYSANFNPLISRIKYDSLISAIPNIKPDNIELVISSGHKHARRDTDIIVEDSADNIMLYSDDVIKILIDKPYNQENKYPELREVKNLVRVDTLVDAVNLIEDIVHTWINSLKNG